MNKTLAPPFPETTLIFRRRLQETSELILERCPQLQDELGQELPLYISIYPEPAGRLLINLPTKKENHELSV